MKKVNWKAVLYLFLLLQIAVPIGVAFYSYITGDEFFKTLKECLIFTFFFLCLIFYLPLLFKIL